MAYQSKHTGKQIDDGIDAIGSKLGRTDDLTNNVVTFVEAGELTDIVSGDTTGTLFGKILKWIKSLGKTAFSDNYNDLTNKPTKLSEFTNDAGYLTGYTETDPTVPSHVKNITQEQINAWDNPSEYTLPTASASTLGGVKVGVGLAINNGVLSATGGGEISNSPNTNIPIYSIWVGTQEQYEAIEVLDANTDYKIIVG